MLSFEEKLIKNVQKLSFAPQELASSKYQQLDAWISQGDPVKFVNEWTITLGKDWFEVRATPFLRKQSIFYQMLKICMFKNFKCQNLAKPFWNGKKKALVKDFWRLSDNQWFWMIFQDFHDFSDFDLIKKIWGLTFEARI